MIGDMIVNLYWKDLWRKQRICDIRSIFPSDKERLLNFVKENFPNEKGWIMEIEHAWYEGKVMIAIDNHKIIGFACWDCSGKGYFGPFGVSSKFRHKGVGTELFQSCMDAMKYYGYGYAIIGWVADKEDDDNSPLDFYKKVAGAYFIPRSSPNETIYSNKCTLNKLIERNEIYGNYDELDMHKLGYI